MNSKTIIAVVVGSIVAFLLGYIIWGLLLMDYFTNNTIQYEGLMISEEGMKLWAIYLSNLAQCILFAWLFTRMNVKTIASGFQAGAIILLFFAITMDLMFYAMMNWYANITVMVVDFVVSAVYGGLIGGTIGFMLGRGEKAAA